MAEPDFFASTQGICICCRLYSQTIKNLLNLEMQYMRTLARPVLPILSGILILLSSCNKHKCETGPVPNDSTTASEFKRVNSFTEAITDISFADNMNGMLVGTYGFAAKTNDGGKTWTVLSKPTSQSLLSAFCLDKNNLFAARNSLHYSNDGGNSFSDIGAGLGADNAIKSICFFNSSKGFVIKGKSIFKTTNGGTNWEGKSFTPGYLNRMQFLSESIGYAWGGISYDGFSQGELYKTVDGGETWISLLSVEAPQVIAAHFMTQDIGYYADFNRNIYKTINGGLGWSLVKSGFAEYITDMVFPDEHSGYIATYEGKVYSTADEGTTWKIEFNAPDTSLNRIIVTSDKKIWVSGNDGLLLTK
jgi:photosystem II stability/assembly factor-like uncharacterized protein